MPEDLIERRANPPFWTDMAGILACLYTLGYLVMVGLLYFITIPSDNKEPLLQLFGLMSAIQMALISFYFGSSKNAEISATRAAASRSKNETVVQEIAKNAPSASRPSGGTIKTDEVKIDAQNATVHEK